MTLAITTVRVHLVPHGGRAVARCDRRCSNLRNLTVDKSAAELHAHGYLFEPSQAPQASVLLQMSGSAEQALDLVQPALSQGATDCASVQVTVQDAAETL